MLASRLAMATAVVAVLLPIGTAAASSPHHEGRLGFAMRDGDAVDIHTARADGSNLRRLTTSPGFDACPDFSPDGRDIVFCSDRTGSFEIWAMRENGRKQEQLTDEGGFLIFPDWSPDGDSIALSGTAAGEPEETDDIWVMDADGDDLTRLTDTPGHFDSYPSWAPDGSTILFVSNRTGTPQLWLVDPDGSDERQLTFDAAEKDQVPEWSPDGRRIAYAAGGDIWLMDADGTDAAPIRQTDAEEFGVAWSPDGRRIAFLEVTVFGRVLKTMALDGSDVRLVDLPATPLVPAWQPRKD